MSKYERCDRDTCQLAAEIINREKTLEELKAADPKIDYLFAYGPTNPKTGELIGPAIKHHGLPALALARVNNLKKRVLGLGDAEILLDGDHWKKDADEFEQSAILHHELYHLAPLDDLDDIGRPKLVIRHHDFEFGWFAAIAKRHGQHSIECKQAAILMERGGQLFWPGLVELAAGKTRFGKLEVANTGK